MKRHARPRAWLVPLALWSMGGCADAPDPDQQLELRPFAPLQPFDPSDPTNFRKSRNPAMIDTRYGMGDAVSAACGTLDCHGQIGRNLRIYSRLGIRLPADPPNVAGGLDTTLDEYNATMRSFIGLQPGVLDAVVADQGQDPNRLLFISKPRGVESHKGGTLMVPGDALDTCMTTWVTVKADRAACTAAYLAAQAPEPAPVP